MAEILLSGWAMAQGPIEPNPRPWWLKSVAVLVLFALLAGGAFIAWRRWEPARLTKQGRAFLEKGDFRNAVLTVRRALELDPSNQAASRLMLEITEQLQTPDSLEWRRRMAELNPGSSTEALAWAGTALKMGRTAAAEQALAMVPEAERNTASYHSKAGTAALSAGQWREADKHYAEALRLEPAGELHQYNYATLQIQAPDAAARKVGADTLERLAKGGRVQAFAQRALITRMIVERKWDEALARSAELQKDPAAKFPDRLVHLDLLRRAPGGGVAEALPQAQQVAATDAEHAATLLQWMRQNEMAVEAVAWAAALDPKIVASPRVAAARGECLVETKDWPALRGLVDEATWPAMEETRLALLSRALRELDESETAKARWSQAVGIAARNRERASRLAYLATRWGWKEEARETLWAAVDAPGAQWALQILHGICQADGDTNGMLRVAAKLAELEPQNDEARNNVAALSLLLNRDLQGSLTAAQSLHEKTPGNAAFASTYALALHLADRSAEGLTILRKLPLAQLREPSIAAYFSILLSATGARAEAGPYLDLAKTAPLLPEEKALLAKAAGG